MTDASDLWDDCLNGTRIGCYEILEPLGKGGMGEVWRARDTSLDRDVAVKVLPDSMALDEERRLRFEREAKLLATLNHAGIAQVYGFEESDGTKYLIMELVEGETLADRLNRSALRVDEALDIALQVAHGLEAAHEKGVVHRDLKPANIMVTEDNVAKILDFGIARAMQEQSTSTGESLDSPTITADYTKPGVVLGTAAYMSPEQARGRAVDKRADIWSFGAVLYECLTGRVLFAGETAADSMGAIMHREPDWQDLPEGTPPTVHLLLRRCLTKDRKHRLHDIADARVELQAAIADPTGSSLSLPQLTMSDDDRDTGGGIPLIGVVGAFAVGALLVGSAVWLMRPMPEAPEPDPTRRFRIVTDEGIRHAAISPDGSMLAMADSANVYMRRMDSTEQTTLWTAKDLTRRISLLYWSPDNRYLAVRAGRTLLRISPCIFLGTLALQ